jgi:hypothetical protein
MKTVVYLFICCSFNDAKPIPEATQRRIISGLRDFVFRGGYCKYRFLPAYHVVVYVSEEHTAPIIKVEECVKQDKINFHCYEHG